MAETPSDQQITTFKPGQDVTIAELREIVAPENTFDFVEETRMRMIGRRVNALLSPDTTTAEAIIHAKYLRILGGEAVLACLPEK